jgi:hypothetical protein
MVGRGGKKGKKKKKPPTLLGRISLPNVRSNGEWAMNVCVCVLMNAILAFIACNIRSCFKQATHRVHCWNNKQTIVPIIISSSKVQATKN